MHFGTIMVGFWGREGGGGGGGGGGGRGARGPLLALALYGVRHSERSTKPSSRSGSHV